MLEVIEKGSRTAQPLLFVHGGWHGAWCWENFLDYFADAGYRAVAVSLRGHGASPGPASLRWCAMSDYLADIATVVDTLGGQPVLIGHSLGGFAVQRFLETRRAPAAVLVGSVPPKGFFKLAMRVWRRHPLIALRAFTGGTLLEFVDTPAMARDYLFCAQTPDDVVEACRSQAGPESLRAAALDPMIRRVRTGLVTTPMLVLGAEHDGFVSTAEVRMTADAYRTEPEFFAMGHNMMLEPGWPEVATRIHDWLQTRDQPI